MRPGDYFGLENDHQVLERFGARHGIEGALYEDLVDLRRGKASTVERLWSISSSALGLAATN